MVLCRGEINASTKDIGTKTNLKVKVRTLGLTKLAFQAIG